MNQALKGVGALFGALVALAIVVVMAVAGFKAFGKNNTVIYVPVDPSNGIPLVAGLRQ